MKSVSIKSLGLTAFALSSRICSKGIQGQIKRCTTTAFNLFWHGYFCTIPKAACKSVHFAVAWCSSPYCKWTRTDPMKEEEQLILICMYVLSWCTSVLMDAESCMFQRCSEGQKNIKMSFTVFFFPFSLALWDRSWCSCPCDSQA